MLVASVLLPTPPFGLATTITGMRPPRLNAHASRHAAVSGYGSGPAQHAGTGQTRCRRPFSPHAPHVGHPVAARPPGPAALARAWGAARGAATGERTRRRALAPARPLRAVSRLPDRRGRRTGGAAAGALGGVAASGALVRHATAAQALGRRGVRLRLGLRAGW